MFRKKAVIWAVLSLALMVSLYAADPTGKWTAEFDTQIGVQKYTYELKAEGTQLTGKAIGKRGDQEEAVVIQDGKINGDEISFVEMLKFGDQELRIEYKGKVSGDEIKFTRRVGEFATEEFVAKRVK
jgi:hypothetical protein